MKNNNIMDLKKIIFDEISFKRKGFKNNSEFYHSLNIEIGQNAESKIFRVSLKLVGEKKDEYDVTIQLSGFFSIDDSVDEKTKEFLLKKNTIAILLPYLRSQLSTLTAQPDTDVEVLPILNVSSAVNNKKADSAKHTQKLPQKSD